MLRVTGDFAQFHPSPPKFTPSGEEAFPPRGAYRKDNDERPSDKSPGDTMNANLNHTSYRMHELARDAALQSAEQHRMAREASGAAPLSLAGLLERRAVRMALAVAVLFVALALATASAHAQTVALAEPGTNEPYHPALVSFRIGIYYQDSGRHEEAVAMFTEMVEAFPRIAEGWVARADSYAALGEYALAIDDYTAAVTAAPIW